MLPNIADFTLREVEVFHPLSQDYRSYWKEQKRRCIEGYWVGGIWMPPALYYYVNFHTIKLNKSIHSNTKSYGRPLLRDLEWEFFYNYSEARGFSGFKDDDVYSCHRILLDSEVTDIYLAAYYPDVMSSTGSRKIYTPARSYMRKRHAFSSAPLFHNQIKNLMMMGSRGSGKSFSVSGLIAHNFLFDGATVYDEEHMLNPDVAEILVGAAKSDRSTDLLKKVKDALDFLPGKQKLPTRTFPSPFSKRYSGSWAVNSQVTAEYKRKSEGTWDNVGSKSNIKHRSFNSDSFAAQGTRPVLLILEECFAPDTKVRLYNGLVKEVKDLVLGEALMSEKGTATYITSLWKGESDMYQINPRYTKSYKVTDKHKLVLEQRCADGTDGRKYLTSMEYLALPKYKKANTRHISIENAVEYPELPTTFDPYLYGLWLGDGCKGDRVIYNSDKEILDYLSSTFTVTSIRRIRDTNTFAYRIQELDKRLLKEKIIHREYLINSIKVRKALLAGLIDSDGYKGTNKNKTSQMYEIACYKHFTDPIKELSNSLGYRVSVKEYDSYDRIFIRGKDLHTLPIKVRRKRAVDLDCLEYNLSTITSVEAVGKGEFIGFQLTDPHFLLEDYSVVHNCGMFPQLKEVHANTVDNLSDGYRKTGMLMLLGTGGDMESGTLDSAEMFYSPDKYDILAFENVWETSGPIAYFVPAYLALDPYKDLKGNGSTDILAAKKAIEDVRKKKRGTAGSSDALNKEMQYRPIVPSEIFLTKTANIFPAAEIRRRLSEIQSFDLYKQTEKKVNLYFDPKSKTNGVHYSINESLTAISSFPYTGDDREGAVVIYEFPKFIDDKVPSDAYIIGCDPFKDDTETGQSLAAIYVMKTSKYPSVIGYDEIVATYIGRPYFGKNEVNETLYKLSLFYGGAKIYFENNVGNVKDYFEKIRRLDLLAKQPVTVFNKKASFDSSPQVVYGYAMSNDKVKWEAIQYLRSWLLQEREENKRNLDLILDPGLLQELLSFNMSLNTDRVMSIVGCILGLEETNNISKRRAEFYSEDSALQKDIDRFIVNNKRIFNVKFPQTTTSLF